MATDAMSDLASKLADANKRFKRGVVAEMMARGWQPPDGWTDDDTEHLGQCSYLGPLGELLTMTNAGASIEEQRAWIERHREA